MNTKALDKLGSDIQELKALDKEITAIEGMAKQAADGNGAKLTIAMNQPQAERTPRRRYKKPKDKGNVKYPIPPGARTGPMYYLGRMPSIIEFAGMNNIIALDNGDFNEEVSDTMLLQVLGLLLSEKLSKCDAIVSHIERRGLKL